MADPRHDFEDLFAAVEKLDARIASQPDVHEIARRLSRLDELVTRIDERVGNLRERVNQKSECGCDARVTRLEAFFEDHGLVYRMNLRLERFSVTGIVLGAVATILTVTKMVIDFLTRP